MYNELLCKHGLFCKDVYYACFVPIAETTNKVRMKVYTLILYITSLYPPIVHSQNSSYSIFLVSIFFSI